ncbi:MAG: DUF4019 domain-containing protein [Opitutaceae bacterium]|jgi:serine/threonine-protein kinase|nr:DUF4019 domain-containing protein [Opitutaceae bacterium]
MTRQLITVLFLLTLLPVEGTFGQEPKSTPSHKHDDASDPVIERTLVWLGHIDNGRYAQSWRDASAGFKNAVTEADWEKALKSVRAPLGTLVKRQLQHRQQTSTLPGAPKGDYVVMQFATGFSRKKSAIETVTFARETDGAWRASGYFIK